MRQLITLGVAFLTMVMLVQCVDKANEPVPEPLGDTINLNDTVSLRVGDKVTVLPDGFELGLDSVIEDSRCPYEYICRDPGRGLVRLWLKKPGEHIIYVNAGLWLSDHAANENFLIPVDTFGCRFSLVALFPYPVDYDPIPQDEYLARIRVTPFTDAFSTTDSVIITDQPPDSIELDPFGLNSVRTIGDSLKINVQYAGGCREHTFQLFMTPPAFIDDYPNFDLLGAKLYLRHDAAGDACEALIKRDLYFDLRPVARLYEDIYGRRDTIVIGVYYYRTENNYRRFDFYPPSD